MSAEFCSRNRFKISRGRRRQGEELAGPWGLHSGLFSAPRFFPNWRRVFFKKSAHFRRHAYWKKLFLPTHPIRTSQYASYWNCALFILQWLLMGFWFVGVVIPSDIIIFFYPSYENRGVTSNKFCSLFSRGMDCAVHMEARFLSVRLSGSLQNSEIWPLCLGTM